jgi:hypothetical protein
VLEALNQLKEELARNVADERALMICLQIFDFVAEESDEHLQMLTFLSLRRLLDQHTTEEELLKATAILVGTKLQVQDSNFLCVLESHFLFIDKDENEFEIHKSYLNEAKKTGIFIHPKRGEPVDDFENQLMIYFVPSEKMRALKAGGK